MVVIEVEPRIVNDNTGTADIFGDETGTPQFYIIRDILQEYLGKDIYVSWNYDVFTFNIESYDTDEGCDTSGDFVEVIETICELFPETYDDGRYKGYQLQFEIISVVEN